MKKPAILLFIVVSLSVVFGLVRKKKSEGLGRVKGLRKPPKIRIVFSRKLRKNQLQKITDSEDVVAVLREVWSSQIDVREEFVALLLNNQNQVLGYHVLGNGGIDSTTADVRLLLAVTLTSLSTRIIIAHNHPAGTLSPSQSDIQITRTIQQAVKFHNIELLDHIILTRKGHYSFANEGNL